VHFTGLGRNGLDDAGELKLDQVEGVRQWDTFENDTDPRVIAMGVEVDIIDDPKIA
jgi:hypothetical protein